MITCEVLEMKTSTQEFGRDTIQLTRAGAVLLTNCSGELIGPVRDPLTVEE